MTPERMRAQFFVGDDQGQAAISIRQCLERRRADFPAAEPWRDPDPLNEYAVEQRRDGKLNFTDSHALPHAHKSACGGGGRRQVDVAARRNRLQTNLRDARHRLGLTVLKLLNAASSETDGLVNGQPQFFLRFLHLVSSPLHGVCARLPVDAGRWAFLFFMSHFFAGGERIHAHVISR